MKRLVDYNRKLKNKSRVLRLNMTDTERVLWNRIRRGQIKNLHFYRQKPVGNYIVDFYCPKAKMVIEVDGGQHYEDVGIELDKIRTEYFEKLGLEVLRFANIDILKNLESVLVEIYEAVN